MFFNEIPVETYKVHISLNNVFEYVETDYGYFVIVGEIINESIPENYKFKDGVYSEGLEAALAFNFIKEFIDLSYAVFIKKPDDEVRSIAEIVAMDDKIGHVKEIFGQ